MPSCSAIFRSNQNKALIYRESNEERLTAASQTVEDYHRMEIFCKKDLLQFAICSILHSRAL